MLQKYIPQIIAASVDYKTCKNDMKYISSAFSLIKVTEYRYTFVTCCSTSPLQGLNMYAIV